MKMKKSMLLLVLGALLAACGGSEKENESNDLKISYNHSGRIFVSYNRDNPLELPDGRVIRKGDISPVFQEIEKNIGANISDVASKSGDTPTAMIELAASRGFTDADVYGGNSTLPIITSYGAQGYFVPLNEYMDSMPNVKKYFEESQGLSGQLKASDGNIYGLPYVAEIGNYARMYHLRHDWVEKLLDSDNIEYDTAKKITASYKPFYSAKDITDLKVYSKKDDANFILKNIDEDSDNIISIQNALSTDGLNGHLAVQALRDYIDENYMDQGVYENRSDLFLSEHAAYDVDELVALWRAIKLNPEVLTGDANKNITTYYARKTSDKADLMRLVNFFGARSFGSDSYGIKATVSEEGNLEHSWGREDFADALSKISEIYSEGLINEDFENYPSGASDFRTYFVRNDSGFMTHDWAASTTIFNPIMKEENEDFHLAAVLPPVTNYRGDFIHFMENTRALKPDGWGISANATPEARDAALKMFDFIYSREGRNLVNYGVEGITWEGKLEGTDYPKLTDWTFESASRLTNGDVSNLFRQYIGSQMSIGYQKELGLELQTTNPVGLAGTEMLNNSTTIQFHTANENPSYRITPTILPLTEDEADVIAEEITVEEYLESNAYLILKKGFGYSDNLISTPTKKEYLEDLKGAGIDKYNEIVNKAYNR